MTAAIALACFCVLLGALSFSLSATAGRLPALVAALTLIPVLWQLRTDARCAPVRIETQGWLDCAVLLAGIYLTGFQLALPAYAAWCWRRRPVAAVAAFAIGSVLLALLGLQIELYAGVLWPG